jgi:MOSC domain-containing protein
MSENTILSAKLMAIYRYPVKGLSPEILQSVELKTGQTLPFDRAYAIENGRGKFDPEQPKYLPKVNFLMLMRNEKLARLKTVFDDETHELTISQDGETVAVGALNTQAGCQGIEQFMTDYMSDGLKGAPRIVHAANHSFSDVAAKCLHIINLESIRELERMIGKPIDPLRFRPNLIIDGPPAFSELDWVGQNLTSDEIRLNVFKRTMRCPATNVDPQSGSRDFTIPDVLFEQFGHRDFGIYAEVETGGILTPSAKLELS